MKHENVYVLQNILVRFMICLGLHIVYLFMQVFTWGCLCDLQNIQIDKNIQLNIKWMYVNPAFSVIDCQLIHLLPADDYFLPDDDNQGLTI